MILVPSGSIQTYTGGSIDPLSPDPTDVSIEDIAHALSNQCRFSGHTTCFYSVAQHSVLCSLFAETEVDPDAAKAAFPLCSTGKELAKTMLMHDAAEAYLVDLPRPLKHNTDISTTYLMAEQKLMTMISSLFQFRYPLCPIAKMIDDKMLVTEKRDLMAPSEWESKPDLDPFPELIEAWTPHVAKRHFLKRFHQLFAD